MTTRAKLIEKINRIKNDDHLEALLRYLEESFDQDVDSKTSAPSKVDRFNGAWKGNKSSDTIIKEIKSSRVGKRPIDL